MVPFLATTILKGQRDFASGVEDGCWRETERQQQDQQPHCSWAMEVSCRCPSQISNLEVSHRHPPVRTGPVVRALPPCKPRAPATAITIAGAALTLPSQIANLPHD